MEWRGEHGSALHENALNGTQTNRVCFLFLSAVDLFQPAHTWIHMSVVFGASVKPFVMGVGNGLAWAAVLIWCVLKRTS